MRWTAVLIAATLLPVVSIACSAEPAPDAVVEVDCDGFSAAASSKVAVTRNATVGIGGRVVLRLCANPSTGFEWEDAVVSAPDVLIERTREFVAPGATMPGSAGLTQWTFEAVRTGACVLDFSYSQPWEGGEKDVWRFELEVTVR